MRHDNKPYSLSERSRETPNDDGVIVEVVVALIPRPLDPAAPAKLAGIEEDDLDHDCLVASSNDVPGL